VDTTSSFDNLHPLEIKVLTAFGMHPSEPTLTTEHLADATQLEPSQLSMAIEWLLAKQLLTITSESVTRVASLTPLGNTYFEQSSPIEHILSAAKNASSHGKRLTIPDLQTKEGLDPSDVSKAVGRLKKEGALLIVQGGCLESTGRPSPSADAMRVLLQELHETPKAVESFPES